MQQPAVAMPDAALGPYQRARCPQTAPRGLDDGVPIPGVHEIQAAPTHKLLGGAAENPRGCRARGDDPPLLAEDQDPLGVVLNERPEPVFIRRWPDRERAARGAASGGTSHVASGCARSYAGTKTLLARSLPCHKLGPATDRVKSEAFIREQKE